MGAQPQFSTPSLQELLLTARTGADYGAGAIRAASEGVTAGVDRGRQLRAAQIKAKLEERGMALKEQTLEEESRLGEERITATKEQTKASIEASKRTAATAKAKIKADEDLTKSQAELNRAKAKALGTTGSLSGSKKSSIMTQAEIQQQATENVTSKLKLLGREIEFLTAEDKGAMEQKLLEAEIKALNDANNADIATSVGGRIDEKTGWIPVIDENGNPGFYNPSEVRQWLSKNEKRRTR